VESVQALPPKERDLLRYEETVIPGGTYARS
jgi:hypothetical protein